MTSGWEDVELNLGWLFVQIDGDAFEADALRTYGEPRIFDQRLQRLVDRVDRYFMERPNQHLEGEFSKIAIRARGFSGRRNDVDHGCVRLFNSSPPGTMGYFLVPSYYAGRSFAPNAMPKYAYTAAELLALEQRLYELEVDIITHRMMLRRSEAIAR